MDPVADFNSFFLWANKRTRIDRFFLDPSKNWNISEVGINFVKMSGYNFRLYMD